MSRVRLGAVGYLNARPLVWGLEDSPRFDLRFDVPSRCADLLHAGAIDVGLIPSIEYLHGDRYAIVPDVAIGSLGPVASVLLFTRRPVGDLRSIAMDTSSRTSVALVRILCQRWFKIAPVLEPHGPDLDSMLSRADAALLIGDNALFARSRTPAGASVAHERRRHETGRHETLEVVDVGEAWTAMTGLPFVWAFWAGRPDALRPDDTAALQRARDEGIRRLDEVAARYLPGSRDLQEVAGAYLRDNIKYDFGAEAQAAVTLFYRYAHEARVVPASTELRWVPMP